MNIDGLVLMPVTVVAAALESPAACRSTSAARGV
jgi:hypothetical protein